MDETVKYKHKLYNWMGVEKIQLAVMAELLLRGEQTLGDLRGRASRMEKIADIAELRPIVDDLVQKNLVIELTPPGRGQIVTHNLYLAEQLDKLKNQYAGGGPIESPRQSPAANADSGPPTSTAADDLRDRVSQLESQVSRLIEEVDRLNQLLS